MRKTKYVRLVRVRLAAACAGARYDKLYFGGTHFVFARTGEGNRRVLPLCRAEAEKRSVGKRGF
jgi:hypothetical protein